MKRSYTAAVVSEAPGREVQRLRPVNKLLLSQLILDHELRQVAYHLRIQFRVYVCERLTISPSEWALVLWKDKISRQHEGSLQVTITMQCT